MRNGPNTLVVIGDTDWWDNGRKSADTRVDSRLRRFMGDLSSSTAVFKAVQGALSRMIAPGQAFYAECFTTKDSQSNVGRHFGVMDAAAAVSTIDNSGTLYGVAYTRSGTVWIEGATVIDATPVVWDPGDTLGLRIRNDSGTYKVQFYVNGVAEHAELSLSSTPDAWRLFGSTNNGFGHAASHQILRVDADELLYLPEGAQPWGAAARVADAGGYSPAASVLTDVGFTHSVDSYGRTVTGANILDGIAPARNAPRVSARSGMLYVEFLLEASSGDHGMVGVVPRDVDNTGGIFTEGYAYYASTGQFYRAGKPMAYGVAVTVGQRIGCFYSTDTRKVWFSVDGVVQAGGNPEVDSGGNTLPVWLLDVVPAIGPSAARWRLCTHAREQLYRPSYAQAWDGADVLPEQHFRGLLGNDPYIERRLHLPQWGSTRSGSPIGAIEMVNADGRYDPLVEWNMRDQRLAVYELDVDAAPAYACVARVEKAEQANDTTLRVLAADPLAPLDVRTETPFLVIGIARNVPLERTSNTSLAQYEFGQGLDCSVAAVMDGGLAVDTWAYSEQSASPTSIYRTVAPNGLHTANVNCYHLRPLTVTNGDFSAWTLGNPTGWTVVNEHTGSRIDQSGTTARVLHSAGASPVVSLSQTVGGPSEFVLGVATIFSRTSGDLTRPGALTGERLNVTGAGVFRANWFGVAQVQFTPFNSAAATDLRIDEVKAYSVGFLIPGEGLETSTLEKTLAYVMDRSGANLPYRIDVHSSEMSDLGYFSNRRPTYRQALQEMLDDWMVGVYPDTDGTLVFDRLASPDAALPLVTLGENDFLSALSVEDDLAPDLSDGIMASYNWRVMSDNEIVGAVTTSERAFLMRECREVRMPAGTLAPFYAHAVGAPPKRRRTPTNPLPSWSDDPELFVIAKNWEKARRLFVGKVKLSVARRMRPAMPVAITHPRYGLNAKVVRVVSIKRPLVGAHAEVRFWG